MRARHTRYTNIEIWYLQNPDNVTLIQIQHLLSDHETGVCNHYEYQGVKDGTIWSWITPLGKRIAHVCHGPPCSNPYEIVDY